MEAALGIISSYLLRTPSTVFADAYKQFEDALRDEKHPPALCVPVSWADDPDDLVWEQVVIKHGSSESHVHECTKRISSSFSAEFSLGPWHASASGGYDDRTHDLNTSATVDKLGASFEIARIDIMRPWLKASLLTYPGTKVTGHRKGGICAGRSCAPAHARFRSTRRRSWWPGTSTCTTPSPTRSGPSSRRLRDGRRTPRSDMARFPSRIPQRSKRTSPTRRSRSSAIQ